MLDEIESKTVHNDKDGDQKRKKKIKKMNEIKLVENLSKNPQSFIKISPM